MRKGLKLLCDDNAKVTHGDTVLPDEWHKVLFKPYAHIVKGPFGPDEYGQMWVWDNTAPYIMTREPSCYRVEHNGGLYGEGYSALAAAVCLKVRMWFYHEKKDLHEYILRQGFTEIRRQPVPVGEAIVTYARNGARLTVKPGPQPVLFNGLDPFKDKRCTAVLNTFLKM